MAELIVPYNAKPDFDNWGPDSYWDLATWVAWHRGLVQKYGRQKDTDGYEIADKLFLIQWNKQTAYSSPILAILQPARFKAETDYIKKYPLLYQYTGLKRAVEQINPLDTSYKFTKLPFNVVNNISTSVGNVGQAIESTSKVIKYAVPILAIGGIIFLSIYAVKKSKIKLNNI